MRRAWKESLQLSVQWRPYWISRPAEQVRPRRWGSRAARDHKAKVYDHDQKSGEWIERGRQLEMQDRVDEALQEYSDAKERSPHDVRGHLGYIRLAMSSGRPCDSELESAAALFPADPAIRYLRGQQLMRAGLVDRAVPIFQSLPNDVDAAVALAEAHLILGHTSSAEDALAHAEELISHHPSPPSSTSDFWLRQPRIQLAHAQLKMARGQIPEVVLPQLGRALDAALAVPTDNGVPPSVLRAHGALLRSVYSAIAGMYHTHGRYALAEQAAADGLQLQADDAVLLAQLGAAQLQLRRPEDAVRSLERARAVAPENHLPKMILGQAYAELGRSGEAVAELQAFLHAVESEVSDVNADVDELEQRQSIRTLISELQQSLSTAQE